MHKEMLKEGRTPAVLRVVPESQAKISRFFSTGERLPANVSTSTAYEDVIADSHESVELQLLTDAAAIEVEREREECTNANELEGEHRESNEEGGGEEVECDDEEEGGESDVREETEEGVIDEYGSNEDNVGHRRVQGYGSHVPKGAKSLGRTRPNNIIYSDESTLMHILDVVFEQYSR